MRVRDIMTSEVECCTRSTDLAAVAMIMWRRDCGIVPVLDEDRRVVGVVTDRDICMATATRHRPPESIPAGDVLSGVIHAVRPETDLHEALDLMRTRQVRRMPVVDSDGALAGIVSLNDILQRAARVRRRGARAPGDAELVEVLRGIGLKSGAEALSGAHAS